MPIDINGVRLRMLVARLAMGAGRPVPVGTLIEDLWGEEPPSEAAGALQGLVSRLRRALAGAGAPELVPGGYRLPIRAEDVDAYRFEELVRQGRRELSAGPAETAASLLTDALEGWRGQALADVLEAPFASAVAARWEDLRATAVEGRFEALLRLGRHGEVLADLESAAAARPLSERLAGLRMRALVGTGRQADALAVYEEMRARLSEELGVDPSPELREVHLALLRGELERPSVRAEPSRLPSQLTSFIGRKGELEQLAKLMATSRLVTIVGPGGAGKTRLSLEAASARQRGRVWFVPLAGVSARDQLTDAVLSALSTADGRLYQGGQVSEATPLDRVAGLLDAGDTVLLLDNCEHLIEAAAELAERLLQRLPQLRILATSREPLAITGEALCHLGPLELPPESPELGEAVGADAVRLFVDRATGVRSGFALDESTVDAVVEICRRLDGMPLALELAAARLRSMSAEQIAYRLDDRFRLLTSGSRTALPRQRTLLAVVEWSWDLLSEPERVLARRLSMFPGGAAVDALEAICPDETLPAEEIVYLLGSLVEKSIVQVSGDGEPRYRMLETIRAYAADQLAKSGDDVRAGFAAYFLALAEEYEPLLRTGEQLRAITVFDAEHDNVVFALQATLDAGDALMASRFVRAMFWYWGIRGMSTQFETFLAVVLAFGDTLPEPTRAAFRVVRGLAGAPVAGSPAEDSPEPDMAGAMGFHPALPLLRMSQLVGDPEFREHQVEQALLAPDPWVRASAHWARDLVFAERGDLLSGAQNRREALRGFEEAGDRWGLVMSLLSLSRDHSLRGEYGSAIAILERAVVISSELNTEEHLHITKTRLARARMRSGDLDGALRDLQAALRQAGERGQRRLAATLLNTLAEVHLRRGELERADEALNRMQTLSHLLLYPEPIVEDLIAGHRLAIRIAEGAAGRARALLPGAVRGVFTYGNANGLAWGAELLAGVLALEGDASGAATALGMSQVIRGMFDDGAPELRALVAELIRRLGADGYHEAYRRGAELPRQDALNRLAEQAGPPVMP
ncbi:BTAD domain-containing putative transcriptional regulator [Nonomuraea sp. LPB2021202275-12-8]|uniref:BTAD domain-containing putative transcriptional regulator n=1 Tax=Nonomuraea sp. LPB2021202275-12-8 TaxID=3120159 RepID=UPI00300DAB9C